MFCLVVRYRKHLKKLHNKPRKRRLAAFKIKVCNSMLLARTPTFFSVINHFVERKKKSFHTPFFFPLTVLLRRHGIGVL